MAAKRQRVRDAGLWPVRQTVHPKPGAGTDEVRQSPRSGHAGQGDRAAVAAFWFKQGGPGFGIAEVEAQTIERNHRAGLLYRVCQGTAQCCTRPVLVGGNRQVEPALRTRTLWFLPASQAG